MEDESPMYHRATLDRRLGGKGGPKPALSLKVAPIYFPPHPQPFGATLVISVHNRHAAEAARTKPHGGTRPGRALKTSRLERRGYGQLEELDVRRSSGGWRGGLGNNNGAGSRVRSLCARTGGLCSALPWPRIRL